MQAAQKAISTPARSTQQVCCFVPHPYRPPPLTPTPTLASRSLTKPSMPARVSASQMDASEAACWKGSRLLRTVPLKMTGSCNVWMFVRGGVVRLGGMRTRTPSSAGSR